MGYYQSMTSRWVLTAILALAAAGCTAKEESTPDMSQAATIKDIMDAMIDPSADFLFESTAEIADANGITKKAPQNPEEWKDVRRRALLLLEAPTLLIMEGRKVARAGEKADFPEVELEPQQIQTLIDGDRPAFVRRAKRLQTAAAETLKAIDAKDGDALFQSLVNVDRACENCHVHYWYPNDKRAREAAEKDGILD
jgi:hypothetical protein